MLLGNATCGWVWLKTQSTPEHLHGDQEFWKITKKSETRFASHLTMSRRLALVSVESETFFFNCTQSTACIIMWHRLMNWAQVVGFCFDLTAPLKSSGPYWYRTTLTPSWLSWWCWHAGCSLWYDLTVLKAKHGPIYMNMHQYTPSFELQKQALNL